MSVDYSKYLKVCKDASETDHGFDGFKSNPDYRVVLEHVSVEQGQQYLNEIKKDVPKILDNVPKFITNDSVGNPMTHYYPDIKNFTSPTTLRYVKVLTDLIKLFGTLDGLDIVEIGVGYGGQCKIINDVFKPKSYTLIDMPEVLELSMKYLNHFKVEHTIPQTSEYMGVIGMDYDLCISNYAFTEIDRKYQDMYAGNIIKNSKMGYITCNFLGQRYADGAMTQDEIFALRPDYTVLQEKPQTAPNNLIYTWNLKGK